MLDDYTQYNSTIVSHLNLNELGLTYRPRVKKDLQSKFRLGPTKICTSRQAQYRIHAKIHNWSTIQRVFKSANLLNLPQNAKTCSPPSIFFHISAFQCSEKTIESPVDSSSLSLTMTRFLAVKLFLWRWLHWRDGEKPSSTKCRPFKSCSHLWTCKTSAGKPITFFHLPCSLFSTNIPQG